MRTKVVAAVMAIAVLALVHQAHANIYVSWRASGGFYFSGSGDPIMTLGSGDSVLAQLIWSPDAVANDVDATTLNYVSGNDVWLANHIITEGSYAFSEYAWFGQRIFNDLGTMSPGGYIYARVFTSTTPTLDDWYYVAPIVLAQNLNPGGLPPDAPQVYELNRDNSNGDALDGAFGAQVVPEPASISLLVLGAAVLGLRRRRR